MKIKDERIEQSKNKIYAELFQYAYLFIVASFVIKSLHLNMTIKECMTEFVIMIAAPLYQLVRTRQMGVVLTSDLKKYKNVKRNVIVGLCGVLLLFLFWIFSGRQVTTGYAVTYIIVYGAVIFLVRMSILHLEERRIKKLEQAYKD